MSKQWACMGVIIYSRTPQFFILGSKQSIFVSTNGNKIGSRRQKTYSRPSSLASISAMPQIRVINLITERTLSTLEMSWLLRGRLMNLTDTSENLWKTSRTHFAGGSRIPAPIRSFPEWDWTTLASHRHQRQSNASSRKAAKYSVSPGMDSQPNLFHLANSFDQFRGRGIALDFCINS